VKVKKYVAPTMPEVMSKIRKELGPDAVILNSKEIKRGGFFGFFEKRNIEVVAVLDQEPIIQKSKGETHKSCKSLEKTEEYKIHTYSQQEIKHLKNMIEHQVYQTTGNYLPDYQFAYQHLIDQEVDIQLAQEIMDTVLNQHEENREMNASQMVMRDIQSEIE